MISLLLQLFTNVLGLFTRLSQGSMSKMGGIKRFLLVFVIAVSNLIILAGSFRDLTFLKMICQRRAKKRQKMSFGRSNTRASYPTGLFLTLGSKTLWMFGRTPPAAIVTSPRRRLSSSSFLTAKVM
jgi:hypothetical protein